MCFWITGIPVSFWVFFSDKRNSQNNVQIVCFTEEDIHLSNSHCLILSVTKTRKTSIVKSIIYSLSSSSSYFFKFLGTLHPEGRPVFFLCLSPVWNLWATSLIPLFCISSLILLPSHVALSVWSLSAFGLFSWFFFPKPHFFPKVRLFCVARVFLLCLSG